VSSYCGLHSAISQKQARIDQSLKFLEDFLHNYNSARISNRFAKHLYFLFLDVVISDKIIDDGRDFYD